MNPRSKRFQPSSDPILDFKPPTGVDRARLLWFEATKPPVKSVRDWYLGTHTRLQQCLTAIGLEEYRSAHGNYPATLEAAVPDFVSDLPLDVMTGQPLIYRTVDRGYILYGVGLNEKDDGGTTGEKRSSPRQLDWVWRMPDREKGAP